MYWLLCYRILVETPGEYGSLEEYFRHYQSPQQVPRPSSELAPVVQETTDVILTSANTSVNA